MEAFSFVTSGVVSNGGQQWAMQANPRGAELLLLTVPGDARLQQAVDVGQAQAHCRRLRTLLPSCV